MNFLKKYYKNTTTFHCQECNSNFTIGFWQWFFTLFHNHISGHAYVKCPFCGKHHWRQCVKVME